MKTPRVIKAFFTIVELSLVLSIILSFYLTFEVKTQRVIYIPKGSTKYIVSYLDKSYDMNIIDRLVINFLGYPQSGWIDLQSSHMSKYDFLYKLTTSKAALKKITLTPGETYYFFLQEVADSLHLSNQILFDFYAKNAYKKDGNIIADTYYLPLGMDEVQVMNYLLEDTQTKYRRLSEKIFNFYNKENWYRYVTIASIIQKEAASIEEMPFVSSVIHNRLKKNMKLQMDGSLNYGKYSHTKVTPQMIKEDTSDYNTYQNKGIPTHPVSAIEFDAIKAAIFPAKTDYLYFVKNSEGNGHVFSNNYKEHVNNINKLKYSKRMQKSNTPEPKQTKTAPAKRDKEEKVFSERLRRLWK